MNFGEAEPQGMGQELAVAARPDQRFSAPVHEVSFGLPTFVDHSCKGSAAQVAAWSPL